MRQKQKGYGSLRLAVIGGNLTAENIKKVAEVAEKYGRGYVHMTSRQGIEIPFIKVEELAEVKEELAKGGVGTGVCGPRVRTITACQGSEVCPSGCIDTYTLAKELDARYFGRELPHKFKFGVTGCQNNCLKAEENDVGIAIGWLFHANGMITLYLGKITALLFYLLCVFWAVRFMPWGKMVMAVIALFPMSLEIASSYSYDCTVNALSFLFIGYTMYLIYEKERVTWKDYAFLTVVGMWMAPCKLVYIFVCGIIFLIPSSKSNNPRGVLAGKIGIIVVIGMVTMLLRGAVVANLTSTPGTGYSDIERGWTLAQILEDPVNSMGVLFNTYFEQGEYYLGTIIGQSLGWLQVKISWINITGFLLCMVFALFTDKKADYMTNKQKVLVGMLSLIMIGGVVLSMWLDFTPPQWKNVAGVQGRYFLPFLPMLVLMLKGKQTLRVERYSKRIMISMYILEILTVFDVWKAMIV